MSADDIFGGDYSQARATGRATWPATLQWHGGNSRSARDDFECRGGFFLPGAFAPSALGQFGNSSRQFFHGPGINNTDFGLSKRTSITESKGIEVRAEFFNIFNHTQFINPDGDVNGSQFGQVTSARDSRIGQLSAKFYW